ncbi:glycoside hydrolase family 99-like domain-containing protein [Novosphingobium sp.]|uniref:glycosyltransferase WbsX family protein n=1 Tax=Novosphingobium sp. TaxID=1874826 RepID=UPI0025E4CDC0|nr:glycoside hydrolase family 99-like domain-containing protein [Novosphingobium sp.]
MTNRSPLWEDAKALPADPLESHRVRAIAYYLPQFHTIPENDDWWGAGFTEWRSVTKALPRFAGHYQPRLPADLGFYDLSDVETIRKQADLAARGGIYGFCIHDYWFGGDRLLETPLELILANRDIPLRFCLNWANENWTRTWDGLDQQVLKAQAHSSEDDLAYAAHLLRCFADPRYIRVDGRPLVMLYRPGILPDGKATVARWRDFIRAAGEADPYVIMPQARGDNDPGTYGMDAVAGFPPHKISGHLENISAELAVYDPAFIGAVHDYAEAARTEEAMREPGMKLFPGVCLGWDNDARRPGRGVTFAGATPQLYGDWLHSAGTHALGLGSRDEAMVFINAWNEWGEGTYLEPDLHFGHAFLAETRRVIDALNAGTRRAAGNGASTTAALRSSRRKLFNRVRRKVLGMIAPKP